MNLPPFNEKSTCPKCGYWDVAVRFCKGLAGQGCVVFMQLTCLEHLDRVCRRCGYGWAEMPMDQLPVSGEPSDRTFYLPSVDAANAHADEILARELEVKT